MPVRKGSVYTDLDEPFGNASDTYTAPDWLIDQSRAASIDVEPTQRIDLPMINISAEEFPEEPPEIFGDRVMQSDELPPEEMRSIEEPEMRRLRLEEVGRKQRERGKEWVKEKWGRIRKVGVNTNSLENTRDTSYPFGQKDEFVSNLEKFSKAYNKKAKGLTLTKKEENNRRVLGSAIGQLVDRTSDYFFGGSFPSFNSSTSGFNKAAAEQIYNILHSGEDNIHDLKNQSVLLNKEQGEDFKDALDVIGDGFESVDVSGLTNSGVRLWLNSEELDKLYKGRSSAGHSDGKGVDVNVIQSSVSVPSEWHEEIDGDEKSWKTTRYRQYFGYKGDPNDIGDWARAIIKMYQSGADKGKDFIAVNEAIGYPGKKLGKNHLHGNMVDKETAINQARIVARWGDGNRFASLGAHPEIYLNTITESDLPVLAYLAKTYPEVMEKLKLYLFEDYNWESKPYYKDRKKEKSAVGTIKGSELYNRFINRPFKVLKEVKGKLEWVKTETTIREKLIELIPELSSGSEERTSDSIEGKLQMIQRMRK